MRQIQKEPSLVQAYNDHFNCIDGENLSINEIKILHYSDMGTQFSHKYSIPRLQHNNSTHWFDGEIIPHPRADLTTLFDQYYHEALSAGYQLEDYTITPYGKFHKASQKNTRAITLLGQKHPSLGLRGSWASLKPSVIHLI